MPLLLLFKNYTLEVTAEFSLEQDHLNFHKLLSCACHVERRHSSHQRCFVNSNLAKEDADGLSNEGVYASILIANTENLGRTAG